ncbi:hypothetical protein FHETE_4268 [Fusarium heterosporum]|uniref:Bromo domain-containing protein n=1 Tax=Fusarium heterosporum TaxID=42747 RepID=A0A8H5WPW4_FUSHE|nr:hypothetical protein FHETE_4268 [Fusarium heterosporum]
MNQPAVYTSLESLLLFQSLVTQGVDSGAFARISEQLNNNALIKEEATYDPTRLKPDALQHLFLKLFGDELREQEKDTTDDPTVSPNSRKRKLGTPPLPTLKEVYENVDKIPILIDRLYARYRDKIVAQIRDDERRFETVQKEIHLLERTERERRARAASQNGNPVLAARDQKSSITPSGPSQSPATAANPATPVRRGPTPQTPVIPPKPPVLQNTQPTVAPPSHLPAGATPTQPSGSPIPPNANGSVLQPPAGVTQTGPRPLQPPQPPKQPLTPKPEHGNKPKDASATPQNPTTVGAALKWEKPYQPPQATHTPPPRQFQSPLVQGPTAPPPAQNQHQVQQQQQQHPQPHLQHPQQVPPQQHWYPQQNAQFSPKPGAQPLSSHPQTPQHVQVQARPQPVASQPPQLQPQPQTQQQQRPQPPQVVQPPQPPVPGPSAPRTPQAQHTTQIQHIPQKSQTTTPAQHAQAQQSQQAKAVSQPNFPQQQQHKPRPTPTKPGLAPPQHAGQLAPPLQPAPPRQVAESPGGQTLRARPSSTTPVPHPRPIQPPQGQAQQIRQIASASPTPPAGNAGSVAPSQQRWPPGYQPQPPQQVAAVGSPATLASKSDAKAQSSHYVPQPPRPGVLDHIIRQALSTPAKKPATPSAPHTPISATPLHVTHGFGTKWAPHSTPSTPGPGQVGAAPQSPAFEPVSPPQNPTTLPNSAGSTPRPTKKQAAKVASKLEQAISKSTRGRSSRTGHKARGVSSTPSLSRSRRSQSIVSHTEEPATQTSESAPKIKDEDATPRPTEDTGDTTADESVHGRAQIMTPGSVSSRLQKRKRQDSPADLPPETTQVLWTRGFTKVSSSALDQISSHRDANMFATRLREKDAPNYRQIVLQPQDITSIRSAIKHGNKAAVQAAGSLPGGDPGTAHVWLPMSDELVPPKGIINSAQLERELVHMFCNAIMYNADPDRGPGAAFMKRTQEEEEEIVGYRLDENGVVKNTRSMFVEVEKLLGDLRSAEKERSAPPPSAVRPASVATPAEETGDDEDEAGERETGTSKRRRIGARG